MLKFTTITPVTKSSSITEMINTRPLIELRGRHKIESGDIKGIAALIIGKAYQLAGFSLPCFFEGNITELDKENGEIYMVLPSGEYAISSKLGSDGIYRLDLKNKSKSQQL